MIKLPRDEDVDRWLLHPVTRGALEGAYEVRAELLKVLLGNASVSSDPNVRGAFRGYQMNELLISMLSGQLRKDDDDPESVASPEP